MKTTIEQQRHADRVQRFAAMTERELTVRLQTIAAELDDNRMDYRLKVNHYEIRDLLRVELAARRPVVERTVESAPVPSAPFARSRPAPMTTERIFINAAERALERAYANNAHDSLSAIESDDSGAIALYHKDDSIYVVTLAECGCKGSQIGRHLCFHQLALADRVGMLDRFIPGAYTRPLPAVRAVSPVVAAELIAA